MKKRILVIDDEEIFCDLLQDLLSEAGYSVETLQSSIPGAADALLGDFDLITLDLNMPDAQGIELARLFHDQALGTPVLVISGYLNEQLIADLNSAGISHTLPKPFTRGDLLGAVENALGSQGPDTSQQGISQ